MLNLIANYQYIKIKKLQPVYFGFKKFIRF